MRRTVLIPALLASALAQGAQAAETTDATAKLSGADGDARGTVSFSDGENGVLITAELQGLPAGWHSFHLHETGNCGSDFGTAGGHFAPDENEHGLLNPGGPHAGDLPNIHVGPEGVGQAAYFTDRVTLEQDSQASLMDPDGSAVIIHANPDSYGEEAGSGERIACGVIETSG